MNEKHVILAAVHTHTHTHTHTDISIRRNLITNINTNKISVINDAIKKSCK